MAHLDGNFELARYVVGQFFYFTSSAEWSSWPNVSLCFPVMGWGRFLLSTVRRGGRLALGSSWVEVGAGLGSSGLVRRGGVRRSILRIYLAEESREIDSANIFGRPF